MSNNILEDIFTTNNVKDSYGKIYKLKDSVDQDEGEFINKQILNIKAKKSIEIGCAYGISSLFICRALSQVGDDVQHYIVDPNQTTEWKSIGINNLEVSGYKFYRLFEEKSEIILPKLLSEDEKFDFAFIDGWHTFDHALIDFFYLNRMLKKNGVIVFDDCGMPGLNRLVRYISNYPCYRVIDAVKVSNYTISRKLLNLFKSGISLPLNLLPQKLMHEIFDDSVMRSDKKLLLNSSMVAIKKVNDDERPWFWYNHF
jgi:predicted O-methyltransferase YrrM